MVLRPWLVFASLVSLVILMSILLVNKLNTKGYLTFDQMISYGAKIADVAMVKVIVWGLVEFSLYI